MVGRAWLSRFRSLRWPDRVALLVVALGLVWNASLWLEVVEARRTLIGKSRRIADSGLSGNGAQDHLPVLVAAVTSDPVPDGAVVYIREGDPRGHLSAYYSYPRKLYMEPERRRWGLHSRMLRTGRDDPGFGDPGPEPTLRESLRFARSRDLPLLEVSPDRVETFQRAVDMAR